MNVETILTPPPMKCPIMQYCVWVYTVCQRTHLGVTRIQRFNFEKRQVNYYNVSASLRPKDEWTCIKKSHPLPDLRGEFDLDLLTLESLPVLLSAVCSSFLSVFFLSDFWSFFLCFLLLSVTDCEESNTGLSVK